MTTSRALTDLASRLIEQFHQWPAVVVAFSGGVDSSVVAAASIRSGRPTRLVTARSPAVAAWQLESAANIASLLRADHLWVDTDEQSVAGYQRNAADRCFFCKQTLYRHLQPIANQIGGVLVSGTNADDLHDHRPGLHAGRIAEVQTPLADANIGKADVRKLAEHFGLPNAQLPAAPCLASRIAYHVEVTPTRLRAIQDAEAWLRAHGLENVRVRLHADELARIEVPVSDLQKITFLTESENLVSRFHEFGFRFVSLDLEGFRSGSLNQAILPITTLSKPSVLAAANATRVDIGENS